ncbi:MAG: PASTA domain-containing protein [Acidobacteriota bacterium]
MTFLKNILFVVLKWGGIALGLLIIAGAGAYLSIKISVIGTEVSIPDVTNREVKEAYGILAEKGLFLEVEGEKNDEMVAEGKIISQNPPAASKTRKGRKIGVILSRGVRAISVPDLIGETARSAKIKVGQDGLNIGSATYLCSDLEEGRIISQSPPPGSEKLKGGGVNLLISQGTRKKVYIMPDILSREYSEVASMLRSHDLRVGIVKKERAAGQQRAMVISQYPPSGYPVSEGESVSITVTD